MTDPMHFEIPAEIPFPTGSFILTEIGGWTGRWVSGVQAFVRGGSQWTHAAVVVGGGYMVEAQPGGAVLSPVSRILDRPFLVADDPVRLHVAQAVLPQVAGAREAYEARLRSDVAVAARSLLGTPYSFLDYAALLAVELGLGKVSGALRRYVESSGHLICSALVDRAYSRAGIELFADERHAGDVTPGDLDRWVQVARSPFHLPKAGDLNPMDPTIHTLRTP